MLVTTTPAECTSVAEHAAPKHVLSAEEIIRAVQAEEAERKAEEEGQEAPKAVVVTLKLSYETFMETAHKLATFVAHIIFDDRSLQEVSVRASCVTPAYVQVHHGMDVFLCRHKSVMFA